MNINNVVVQAPVELDHVDLIICIYKTLTTYNLLKAYFRKEYKDEASHLDIHTKLISKKTPKETYLEYMYTKKILISWRNSKKN